MSKVTGVGVKALVQRLPALEFLDLDYCDRVSADAVEYARKVTGGRLAVSCRQA